jgi:LacI family transcriptional regulator
MKRVTIDDVAELAQVSTATVSRFINKNGYVSARTAKRIKESIEALEYSPNYFAQQMGSRGKKSRIIGTIFASRKSNFYQDELFFTILQGIGDIVDKHKYNLLISHIDSSSADAFDSLPTLINDSLVEGLIIGGVPIDIGFLKRIDKIGLPVVIIGNYEEIDLPQIVVDNFKGGYLATEHLIKLGHTSIGMICGDPSLYSFRDKISGYRQALLDYSIPFDENLLIIAEENIGLEQAGFESAKKLLARNPSISALFISDSYFKIGVLEYLRDADNSNHLSVVSYSTTNQLRANENHMAYICIDELSIGHAAANHLFGILEGDASKTNIVMPVSFIEGSSTKQKED